MTGPIKKSTILGATGIVLIPYRCLHVAVVVLQNVSSCLPLWGKENQTGTMATTGNLYLFLLSPDLAATSARLQKFSFSLMKMSFIQLALPSWRIHSTCEAQKDDVPVPLSNYPSHWYWSQRPVIVMPALKQPTHAFHGSCSFSVSLRRKEIWARLDSSTKRLLGPWRIILLKHEWRGGGQKHTQSVWGIPPDPNQSFQDCLVSDNQCKPSGPDELKL